MSWPVDYSTIQYPYQEMVNSPGVYRIDVYDLSKQ